MNRVILLPDICSFFTNSSQCCQECFESHKEKLSFLSLCMAKDNSLSFLYIVGDFLTAKAFETAVFIGTDMKIKPKKFPSLGLYELLFCSFDKSFGQLAYEMLVLVYAVDSLYVQKSWHSWFVFVGWCVPTAHTHLNN